MIESFAGSIILIVIAHALVIGCVVLALASIDNNRSDEAGGMP